MPLGFPSDHIDDHGRAGQLVGLRDHRHARMTRGCDTRRKPGGFLLTVLPMNLAGLRPRSFPSFNCALAPSRRAHRRPGLSLLPSFGRRLFKHCRSLIPAAVWAGAERLCGCSASRSNFIQPTNQLRRQALADVSHLFVAFRDPGSDELEPSERRTEACSLKTRMRFNP